jgi:hypothetical protein
MTLSVPKKLERAFRKFARAEGESGAISRHGVIALREYLTRHDPASSIVPKTPVAPAASC